MSSCIVPALRSTFARFSSARTLPDVLHHGRSCALRSSLFHRPLCITVEPDAHRNERVGGGFDKDYSAFMDESELSPPAPMPFSKVSVVNDMISKGTTGRLFCIVFLGGRQFKITTGDIIVTDKLACDPGSEIYLNKVLLVGASDFTLIGTPVLMNNVRVRATVIEQTRTPRMIIMKRKRRSPYSRRYGHRQQITMLRINDIVLEPTLKDGLPAA